MPAAPLNPEAILNAGAADRGDAIDDVLTFRTDAAQLSQWAEDGRDMLAAILSAAHAPDAVRVMRQFTQKELIENYLGSAHVKPLRKWVRSHVIPRTKTSGEEGRVKLTIEDFHAYMAEHGLLPRRPEGSRAMRLMIGAYKGGSAKSSMTLHLAHALGIRGWRVLVVDSDPQATLTKAFGVPPELVNDESTLRPVFEAVAYSEDGEWVAPPMPFLETHIPSIKLTPANISLMQADMQMVNAFRNGTGGGFYTVMDESLKRVDQDFDFVLVDTPPAFSMTSIAMLYAAEGLILPMPTEIPDFAASFDFCEMVGDLFARLGELEGTHKTWNPVIVAHSKVKSTQAADQVRRLAAGIYKGARIEEFIPDTAAVSNSFGDFKSVFEATSSTVDGKSLARAREAYMAMTDRLLRVVTSIWDQQVKEVTNG